MTKGFKILVLLLAFSFIFVIAGISYAQEEEAVCAVRGNKVDKEKALSFEYKGETYYFCCGGCKSKFEKDPEKYIAKLKEAKDVFTCTMHPEVKSDKPGECPKCGMDLVKMERHGEKKEHMHMHGEEKEHMHGEEAEHKHGEEGGEHQHQGWSVDPVCEMKIEEAEAKATYEYNGKKYYFCSEKDKKRFAKNPKKFVTNLEKIMATCPVSGEKILKSEASSTKKYNGETYYFCCDNCLKSFNKDPDKYAKKK